MAKLGSFLALYCTTLVTVTKAQVVFIDAPSGKIYIPPPGYPAKEVACRTNATASIKWIQDPGANELDGNVFNIIKKSNTSSVMRLKYEDIIGQVFVILLLPAHEFYCKAGTARSSTFDFAFGDKPSIALNPTDVTVNAKETADFTCDYKRDVLPFPTDFRWNISYNSGEVRTLNHIRMPAESSIPVFTIQSAEPSDAGTYRCIVTNEFGDAVSRPATLTVHYFGEITLQAKPIVVPDQSEVTVECTVDALPAATEIQLSRGDGPFFSSSNSSLIRPIGTDTATTNQVRYKFLANSEWMGSISCYGRNTVGSGKKSVNLTVQTEPAAPNLCEDKTIPSTRSLTYSFKLGDDGNSPITAVMISCYEVEANTKNTLDLAIEYNHTTKNFNTPNCSMAELVNLTPATKYGCYLHATNDVGKGEASARFYRTTEATAPAKPALNPRPLNATENTLTISWTVSYDGGKPITKYTIKWGIGTMRLDHTENLSTQETTYTLNELKKGTEYYVQVQAENDKGTNSSDTVSYTTLCFPGTPSDIQVNDNVDYPDTSIKLQLAIPSNRGCGEIVDYIVTDVSTSTELPSSLTFNNTIRAAIITVSGLQSETQYSLQVSVQNERGTVSPASSPVTFTTKETTITTDPIIYVASSSGDGGPSIVIIIVVVIVIILAAAAAIAVCFIKYRSNHRDSHTIRSKSFQVVCGGYDEYDTKQHPGPNSGSTYSFRLKDPVFKEPPKQDTIVYTEVDVKESSEKPKPLQQSSVQYATIDCEAARKRREQKEAEMKNQSQDKSPAKKETPPPAYNDNDNDDEGTHESRLSTLV